MNHILRQILRGGSWGSVDTPVFQGAFRYWDAFTLRYDNQGFRLVKGKRS